MSKKKGFDSKKIIFWAPRVLGIFFCIFIEIFVLLAHGFTLVSLIENTIVMLLLIALLLSWKWPLQGGMIYILLALLYFAMSAKSGHALRAIVLSLPLLITGMLFILDWDLSSKK